MFNEKLQEDLSFQEFALRNMDSSPRTLARPHVRPKIPRSSRVGILGQPGSIQMDAGGEWKNLALSGSFKFQAAGARHWVLDRRN